MLQKVQIQQHDDDLREINRSSRVPDLGGDLCGASRRGTPSLSTEPPTPAARILKFHLSAPKLGHAQILRMTDLVSWSEFVLMNVIQIEARRDLGTPMTTMTGTSTGFLSKKL